MLAEFVRDLLKEDLASKVDASTFSSPIVDHVLQEVEEQLIVQAA